MKFNSRAPVMLAQPPLDAGMAARGDPFGAHASLSARLNCGGHLSKSKKINFPSEVK